MVLLKFTDVFVCRLKLLTEPQVLDPSKVQQVVYLKQHQQQQQKRSDRNDSKRARHHSVVMAEDTHKIPKAELQHHVAPRLMLQCSDNVDVTIRDGEL